MVTPYTLTLGPVLYLWNPEKWRDFYYRIADEAPVSTVSIGEAVCSKRMHFVDKYLDNVVARLEAAGKQVVLSSLAQVTIERERKDIRKVISKTDHLIEANDLSAIALLDNGQRYIIGPFINVYNGPTATVLAKRGAEVICLPPELPLSSLKAIATSIPDNLTLEVFAFGRLPLAISARCAHARAKGHIKDNCQFVCGDEPNGLSVQTLNKQNFLTLNGVQTMSHSCQALINDLDALQKAGINRFRLSPQDCDMVAVANVFAETLEKKISPEDAVQKLQELCGDMPLSNGFLYAREGAKWVPHSEAV